MSDEVVSGETVLDLSELTRRVEAEEYRSLGEERHAQGDYADAAAYYQMSLDLFPTPEAHVALAWAMAARGIYDQAIAECRDAITLDPDLGNPYNDIGVYLVRMSDDEEDRDQRKILLEEAVTWFEKAIRAPHYDCRNYPYYHLGRLKEQQGRFTEARDYYYRSLQEDPEWNSARVAYRRALSWLN